MVGHEAHLILVFNIQNRLLGSGNHLVLLGRNGHIRNGDGDGGAGGVTVTGGLDGIQHLGGNGKAVLVDGLVDDLAQLLLAAGLGNLVIADVSGIAAVHEAQILRNVVVEDDAARGDLHQTGVLLALVFAGHAHQNGAVRTDDAFVVGHQGLILAGVHMNGLVGSLFLAFFLGSSVGSEELVGIHHSLSSQAGLAGILDPDGLGALLALAHAVHGQVVGTQHHVLRGNGDGAAVLRTQQVVGGEHQDTGLSLCLCGQGHMDCHLVAVEVGVEGGTGQGVQLQSTTVNQHGLESLNTQTVQGRCAVQHDGVILDDEVQCVPNLGDTLIHHFLGGLDVVGGAVLHQLLHDEGTEQLHSHFLGHAALVDLQLGADNDNASAGVVDTLTQQVLTETALLALQQVAEGLQCAVVGAGNSAAAAAVIDQSVHSLLQHALFVAHDDVGGVQLDQSLQTVVAVDDAAVQVVQVRGGKAAAIQLHHGAQFGGDDGQDVNDHPLGLVAGETEGVHHFQTLDDTGLLLAGGVLQLGVELGGQRLQIHIHQQLLDGLSAHTGLEVVLILFAVIAILLFGEDLVAGQGRFAGVGNDIVGEVQHLLQNTGADVQQQAHTGRDSLKVPDVGNGGGQLNVAHALTAHLGTGDLDAAAVADLTLVTDLLILTAVALPVLGGSKDLFAEQAVSLGLQSAVVNRFRLLDLTIGPFLDLLRRSHADLNGIKGNVVAGIVIDHVSISSLMIQIFSLTNF